MCPIERKATSTTSLTSLLMAVSLVYAVLMLGLCSQSEFTCILVYGLTSFAIYFTILRRRLSISHLFLAGLACRLGLVAIFPGLSDDIYRFIWDGRLITNGLNPYSYLPSEILDRNILGLQDQLYSQLNSPNYYTIYPPISQFLFWLSTVFTDNVNTSAIILKSIFVIAEVATFGAIVKLLKHLQRPVGLAAIYWLNPLIIIEGVGNLHFEIIMIAFLSWGIYHLFSSNKMITGALLISLSVATKLLPLMFLPIILFRLPKAQSKKILSVFTAATALLFLPILLGLQISNFAASVDLYFQKFEFNASIYYVTRYIGTIVSGYNLIHYIGPLLGILTVALIVRQSRKEKASDLQAFINFSLFAFTTYLLLATTVHPWYLCIPVFCSVFLHYKYAVAWSALIGLTYINYSNELYSENLSIVALEYAIVLAVLLFENQTKKRKLDI